MCAPIHEVSLSSACCSSRRPPFGDVRREPPPVFGNLDLGILREATLEPVVRGGSPPREKPPTVLGLRWESCAAEEVRPAGCPLRLGKKEVGELAVPPFSYEAVYLYEFAGGLINNWNTP